MKIEILFMLFLILFALRHHSITMMQGLYTELAMMSNDANGHLTIITIAILDELRFQFPFLGMNGLSIYKSKYDQNSSRNNPAMTHSVLGSHIVNKIVVEKSSQNISKLA